MAINHGATEITFRKLINLLIRKRGSITMAFDEVTLDELLGKLRSGHIGNINDYYRKVFIDFLEELDTLRVQLEKNSKELEVLRKAYGLMAKDYCENMGCAFCDHHAKCLEANHFESLEGKDFLQKTFIDEATPASEA